MRLHRRRSRTRLCSLVLLGLAVAACQRALESPSAPAAAASAPAIVPSTRFPHPIAPSGIARFSGTWGGDAGIAAPVDAGTPVAAGPTPAGAPAVGTTITLNPAAVIGPADSHLLGTCRNHVAGLCPNLQGKLDAMRAIAPTWGARRGLYRIGHGITDGRTDHSYMLGFHFEQCWDQYDSYPYDDIRAALHEAAAMNADQIHVVNFGTSDPGEAARYVSFLNHAGDADRLPHPADQQNVPLFEIGNEIAWRCERGHDEYAPNETAYAARAADFARAMRAASDVPIGIGAVASINSNWEGDGWAGGADSVRHILATMGDQVDFLVFHGYPSWPCVRPGDLQTIMAQAEWNRQKLETEILPAIRASGRDVRLANTEYFTNLYNDANHAQGLFGALYTADATMLAMNEQFLANVEFCFSHGTNADSAYFANDDPSKPTPIYTFQQLLAGHWGDTIVQTTSQGMPTRHVELARGSLELPVLASAAATSADGSRLYLMVLNRTNDTPVTAAIDAGCTPSLVTRYTLLGDAGWDSKTVGVDVQVNPPLGGLVFPPATLTLLEIGR